MIIHLVSDLNRALEIKARLYCPHIHLIIEEDCGLFTANLVWLEVMSRATEVCLREGTCIVSFSDLSRGTDRLSYEDEMFLLKKQSELSEKMRAVEVIKDEGLG